ncbi:TIGR04282 family arsenosugar biosynthesis glycosyltransferase [Roseivirga misakiensis]|uniref:DUF2064 domain-containing protein n=1 Tax=Roseivirga misakiensis TaxID=1563681 RepID=A0A1E5T237_9BACT|nr:DUF2064 domain-containing protein [Roseivirga misakiensis]OEK05438.1 hypothetical protein BFP71_18805 [Roseivirga misakiensis]
MSIGNTAILFFSRTQHDEFKAKTFGLRKARFADLYKFLVKKSLNTAKSTGLPVIEIYSDQQEGSDFGERLTAALKTVSDRGYSKVIVIGNDAPELTVNDILTADKQLSAGKQALGKDRRGGAYLIGLDITKDYNSVIKDVDWGSHKIYEQLSSKLGEVYELDRKIDLNYKQDIRLLICHQHQLTRGVLKFFKSFIKPFFSLDFSPEFQSGDYNFAYSDRGPPVLV